ncbi:MAG: M28 family metallopeptidase [Streptomycetales bacterium]
MSPRTLRRGLLAATAALALAVPVVLAPSALADPAKHSSEKLQKAVTLDGVKRHLRVFQAIADHNDGIRASGTSGFEVSADYVAGVMRAAGHQVTVQEFEFPFFNELSDPVLEQVSPDATTYPPQQDFATMTYSGAGDVTATVEGVDLALADPASSTSGCEAADFTGFTSGNIALVQRGACTFAAKTENAQAAGATGVIVFNQGNDPGRMDAFAGTLGGPVASVPVVGASFALGQDLADPAGTVAHLATDTVSETRTTSNVIAETREGRDDNVVMLGAHLDSVTEGPGINDNGSGSAAILETAWQMRKMDPENTVRFAWWGAEELGLLGSEHYVSQLSQSERDRIALYLNFDMVASPNFARFVFDGDDSDGVGAGPGPEGSAAIEQLFVDHFDGNGLPSEGTDFDGRSDYGPFIAVGLPAGGLFTGAEVAKTGAQAATYGGQAGIAFDPCYHQACDTIDNINNKALNTNADAIAHAAATYAFDTSDVNGVASLGASQGAGELAPRTAGHVGDLAR